MKIFTKELISLKFMSFITNQKLSDFQIPESNFANIKLAVAKLVQRCNWSTYELIPKIIYNCLSKQNASHDN